MNFNTHYGLEGQHAFLSPSQSAWVNYDEAKLIDRFATSRAAERGTRLHALAAELITLGVKLPNNKSTLSMYVNDAIRFRMKPEQILYYSDLCFGTADAISFERPARSKKGKLRIHDLKTGVHKASMRQLHVYMAIFCLEYDEDPFTLNSELRIYQNDEVMVEEPDPNWIDELMHKIIFFDNLLHEFEES